jgi:hypothetical protein
MTVELSKLNGKAIAEFANWTGKTFGKWNGIAWPAGGPPTYTSHYPTLDQNHVRVTNREGGIFEGYYMCDPSKSLVGTGLYQAWLTSTGAYAAETDVVHIDVGSQLLIKRIYYENSHYNGGYTARGVKNFILMGTNVESASWTLAYATDTNWNTIDTGHAFDQHVAADQADPKYIVLPGSAEYQFYRLKIVDNWGDSYVGLRRIELQTQD